ncbi:hypothetical protein Tco_1347497, partial [Tanacetum coccineum]
MSSLIIPIVVDPLEERVASSTSIIILFDTEPAIIPPIVPAIIPPVIPADILALSAEVPVIPPIAPEAEAAGVLDMIIYSFSESGLLEDPYSPEHAPIIPSTSPFLFSNSSKISGDYYDSDSSKIPPSHDPYEVVVTRWRSNMAVHLSSPGLSSPSPSTPVLPSTPVEDTIAPSNVIAPFTVFSPYSVHTSPIRDTPASVIKISPVPHVVCHRTRITTRKGVMWLRHVMTPARSASLCLSRARP